MKKVKFNELDDDNTLLSIESMLTIKKQTGYPEKQIWKYEEDVIESLAYGLDADDYFSFYLNDFDEVTVKIG